MPRGGKRAGSGAKPKPVIAIPAIPDAGFATRVLERIHELGIEGIKTAEDYQLHLLKCGDLRVASENFNKLINRRYGLPAQAIFKGDTREEAKREVDFGNLPMPASNKPGDVGKPN